MNKKWKIVAGAAKLSILIKYNNIASNVPTRFNRSKYNKNNTLYTLILNKKIYIHIIDYFFISEFLFKLYIFF